MEKFLIVHGHFYQPPRENPWLDSIEKQQGAYPYHDYNEKIAAECYTPNAVSKYLDGFGRIEDIVNNYEYMSFNFGPTLLGYLKENHFQTYERIIKADKESIKKNNGHGNAVAQVYNHIIMPLASKRDKYTQVIWGIKDFENHFGRRPEGMWLSETAINHDTVRVLIDCGIKFTILSPYQADKIRKNGSVEWENVDNGSISPGRSYRVYDKDKDGKNIKDRYLDVFFYDRILAPAISFEHLLRDAEKFHDRIRNASSGLDFNGSIVNIATDGETFGHHEPFGNMALTALIKKMEKSEISFINYGYHLEKFSPEYEVLLKDGDYGTAWSCSHGVGRWYRDCGCTTDSPDNWNQEWRTPLRDGFNYLKEQIDEFFEENLKKYTKDPWLLRDEYIDVLNNKLDVQDFLKLFENSPDKGFIISLFEMQKYSLYMFTSCGWFFGEISRIEPVQNMKYAIKALEYMGELDPDRAKKIESSVKTILKSGKSNIKEFKDGCYIWEKLAKGAVIDNTDFINQFSVLSMLGEKSENTIFFLKNINILEQTGIIKEDGIWKNCVHLSIEDVFTGKIEEFVFCSYLVDEENIYTYIFAEADYGEISKLCIENSNDIFEKNNKNFIKKEITDLFYDQREMLFNRFIKERTEKNISFYKKIYEENLHIIEIMLKSGLKLPESLKVPYKITMSKEIINLILEFFENRDMSISEEIKEIIESFVKSDISYDNNEVETLIYSRTNPSIKNLSENICIKSCENILTIVEFVINSNLNINFDHEKNIMFDILKELVKRKDLLKKEGDLNKMDFDCIFKILKTAEYLNLNVDKFRKELNPFL